VSDSDAPALPDAVRVRVITLAADALGRLPAEHLPAALKRVAAFAPARRARVAGRQIAAVLENDETFREHLAVQVRASVGELGRVVTDGEPGPEDDPVEVAAAAYLLRPDGWQELLQRGHEAALAEQQLAGARHGDEQVEKLHRRVTELQDEVQRLRARSKEQVERLKADNAELRRRLGDARVRLRDAVRTAEQAQEVAAEEVRAAQGAAAQAEAEVRRLRNRVSELENDLMAARRVERSARVEETVRAKLLVDTLVNAAQGLQRELALPAVDRLPADTVAAEEAEAGNRASTGRGSLPVGDPALLEELLRLPRAHLVVDGYNVTKNAWPGLSLERQRERLLTGAAALLARTGAEVTVVFDAADTRNRPLVAPPRGVRVLFSPYGVIADDVIRDLVAAEPQGRGVVVASSDQEVARDVVAAGFRVVRSEALIQLLAR
jgi:predicted RNA-binding protein with PIN domain